MGLFSGLFGAVGKVVSGLLGRKDAKEANQMSWDQMLHQNAFNADEAKKAFQRNIKGVRFQDRLNDRNTLLAQRFQAREAAKSRLATDRAAVRARKWGVQDYRQQKADMADQFVRLRRAAKKGGFNPLTALGSAIIPNPAGGITSSSYAAASGVGAATASAPGASVAMGGYGQPIAVPSLASNEAILGGINELGRELTGEAAVERANAQLYHDIAKVELEQMKARLPQPVVPDFGNLGKQAVPQGPLAAVPSGWSLGGAGSPEIMPRFGLEPGVSAKASGQSLANRLGWPVEVQPESVHTNMETVIRNGKAYSVPKDDIEDWLAKEAWIAVQGRINTAKGIPGLARGAFDYVANAAPVRRFTSYLGSIGQDVELDHDFYADRIPNY